MSSTADAARKVVIIAAMRSEMRAVLRALSSVRRLRTGEVPAWEGVLGGRGVRCVLSGIGGERAARAVAGEAPAASAIFSVGFAGGLVLGVDEGEMVVADEIIWEENGRIETQVADARWRRVLEESARRSAIKYRSGRVYSAERALLGTVEKGEAGRRFGALAVEMEGRGIVREARRHQVPVAMARIVVDAVDLDLAGLPLPGGFSARMVMDVAIRPAALLALARLASAAGRAGAVLTKLMVGLGEMEEWT